MDTVRTLLACLFGLAVGAAPGAWIAVRCDVAQGVGVAILGALIGLGISVSGILYKTSPWGAMRRALKGYLWATLQHNLMGLGDKVVSFDKEPSAGQLARGGFARGSDLTRLRRRLDLGARAGALLGAVIGIPVLIVSYVSGDDPNLFHGIAIVFSGGILSATLVGVYGAAIGMITVPGRHRRNIAIGTTVGFIIGVAQALAGIRNAVEPRTFAAVVCCVFTTVGTACGECAPENFSACDEQDDSSQEQ